MLHFNATGPPIADTDLTRDSKNRRKEFLAGKAFQCAFFIMEAELAFSLVVWVVFPCAPPSAISRGLFHCIDGVWRKRDFAPSAFPLIAKRPVRETPLVIFIVFWSATRLW